LGKQQLILVVEDDPRVQKLSVQRLEALNYRCVTANNGSDALLAMEANPDIDLVFTDLVMPGGMSGYELTEHLGRHRPELPVLMTSGYAEDLLHADELLRKPYKMAELATMLEDLLN
jgi:CheY-like chemotaxis protein